MSLDRKKGAFYGLAIGDALGAPVEFCLPGSFDPITNYRSGGKFSLKAGEWTDDTSMALALANSMAKGWNLQDQASNYLAWLRRGVFSVNGICFDVGNQTSHALHHYEQYHEFYRDRSNPTNGSIMRLAPVPIAYYLAPDSDISRKAAESSIVTHANSICTEVCSFMALFMAGLIRGADREKLFSRNWKETTPYLPVELLNINLSTPKTAGGDAVSCLVAALWAFMTSNSFEEAVLKAVNLGNDADTVGAVCGQISGAYWGFSEIPRHLIDGLARRDMIDQALSGIC